MECCKRTRFACSFSVLLPYLAERATAANVGTAPTSAAVSSATKTSSSTQLLEIINVLYLYEIELAEDDKYNNFSGKVG